MEDRDMFAYMVETQRMMADNLVKLTEVEQDQNERIAANEERTRASDERFNILLQEARADRMENQRRYEELKAEIEHRHEEQKAESDRKFEALLERIDRKLQ